MNATRVCEQIWWVGVNDRTTARFENLWALPTGVSYNSYLIVDDKCALIDGVKADFFADYLNKIEQIIGEGATVDYLIVNHVEPDHSGAIRMLRRAFPDMVVVGNKQTLNLLRQFYGPDDKTLEITDGATLKLGLHELQFVLTPMVHWPETMVTFEKTTGSLFSCDAFGSYGALDGSIFDDELNMDVVEEETRRYYATIVARFGSFVQKALAKCATLPIVRICPSHGPVHRSDVKRIVSLYDRMSRQETEPGAVVVYGSMYGNTAVMAEAMAEGLKSCGLSLKDVKVYDVSSTHLSVILRDITKYRGLALVSCCYNMGIFPGMLPLLEKLENSKIEGRSVILGGSYSWSKGAELKPMLALVEKPTWNFIGPAIEIVSSATEEQLDQCRELGRALARNLLGQPCQDC